MIGEVTAIIMTAALAAEPWVPDRAKMLEAEGFTELRGTEDREDEGATGGQAVLLAKRDAEVAVRFQAVAGTYVCALRCKARSSGSNSVFVHLGGQRLRPLFAPVEEWGEPRFEFRIDEAGEHVLSFTLRESPGFSVDWLRVEVCPILMLKPLFVETNIAVDGEPAAAIVAPASIPNSVVAEVVEDVRGKTGAVLPVRRPESVSGGAETSLIAVGGVNDNELIRWLWGWGYTRCGPKRPGPGGYVVETVHDPFGTGKNVVVLGGMDEAGLRQAVERFCELVPEGPTARIGHVVEVVEKKRSFLVAPKPDFIEYEKGRMATWLRTGAERRLAKTSIGYGAVYYQNGHAEWAELFKHGLYRLRERMLERNKLDLGFRDAWLYRLVRTWDLVEEMPHITDEDRLRITNYILDLVCDCRKAGYFRKMKPGVIRWNHQTVPALGMLWAGEYFWKYYRLPEAKEWSALARTCFEPQLQAFKPLEDAQGYQWGTLTQVLTYTHASGDYTYYRSNSHRRACELAHMTIDNLGYAACFGDHPAQPSASHVPAMASWADWFYDDPRFAWVAGESTQGTVEPREPVDLLGTVPFPLHR